MNTKYPLEGIKVVEMGTHVAIPNAAKIMADFGATVIKIEPPAGDGWRYPGPEFSLPAEVDENPLFTMQNSNKRLVGINIKSPEGVSVLKKLISDADVFLTSVRQQSLRKCGLDYDSLHAEFPRLIYCLNTGYGEKGEEADRPGYDQATFWARTGATCDWVEEGNSPFRPSLAFGDLATGSQLLSGVLMALLGRERTGKGTKVSASLLGTGIWLNGNGIVSAQECYGHVYPESRTNLKNPFTSFYQAADGEWFTIVALITGAGEEALYRKMFRILEIKDWLAELDEGRFCRNKKEITTRVRQEIGKRPSAEWYRILQDADITFERCAHLKDLTTDKQAWDNGYFAEVTFQNGNKCALPQTPIQLSEYGKKDYQVKGAVGEETEAVLLDAGFGKEEIDRLKREKAIV